MIIASIITLWWCIVWRWLITQSLQFYRLRQSTIWVLIGMSMCCVAIILLFPQLYHYATWTPRTKPLSIYSATRYMVYSVMMSIILWIIVFYRWKQSIIIPQCIAAIAIWITTIVIPRSRINTINYAILAAWVEEYIKYYVWLWTQAIYGYVNWDILLFSIMSGLWFACIENIVYMIGSLHNPGLIPMTSIRRVIGPIVHMWYSWLIAYWYLITSKYWYTYRWLAASSIVVTLIHARYNSVVVHRWRWAVCVIWIIGYTMLSYFLYQCDRLYITPVPAPYNT